MTALNWKFNVLVLVLAVCWNAEPVCAGFISVLADDELAPLSASVGDTGATTATRHASRREREEPVVEFVNEANALPWDGASSSMGGATSGRSPLAPAFAITDAHSGTPGQIVAYLIAQPGVELPVPFLSGVFRPPRC